jgi:hypothetical protein
MVSLTLTWPPSITQAWLELPASHLQMVTRPLLRRGGLPASRHMAFLAAAGDGATALAGAACLVTATAEAVPASPPVSASVVTAIPAMRPGRAKLIVIIPPPGPPDLPVTRLSGREVSLGGGLI